jgi:hypothetical protein
MYSIGGRIVVKRTFLIVILLFISGCSIFRGSSQNTGKSPQLKTVDAIRDIGTAVEAYKLANGSYPVVSSGEIEELQGILVPKFLSEFHSKDAWGNSLEYYCLKQDGPYFIISLGSDHNRDIGLYQTDRSPSGLGFKVIENVQEDIIFSNGVFVRYPQGIKV